MSGTFAEGRGVFFKFKQSSQTSFEGVHELEVTFAVPAAWQAGGVRVSATARGHKPRLWMDQPTVFGQVTTVVELYPEGDYTLRKAATRRLEAAEVDEHRGWGLGELFLTSGHAAKPPGVARHELPAKGVVSSPSDRPALRRRL